MFDFTLKWLNINERIKAARVGLEIVHWYARDYACPGKAHHEQF